MNYLKVFATPINVRVCVNSIKLATLIERQNAVKREQSDSSFSPISFKYRQGDIIGIQAWGQQIWGHMRIMNYPTCSLKHRQKLKPEEMDWCRDHGCQEFHWAGEAASLSPRAVSTRSPVSPCWPFPERAPRLLTLRYSSKLWMVTGISFPPFFSSMLGNPGRVKSNPRSSTEQPFIVRVSNAYCRLSLV